MSKNDFLNDVVNIVIWIGLIAFFVLVGFSISERYSEKRHRQFQFDAVEQGVAEFVVDKQGNVTFQFIEKK